MRASASTTSPRTQRRRTINLLATQIVSAAGLFSILVLVGIFALLLSRALQAFGGGIETQPLTQVEQQALGPDAVAALQKKANAAPRLLTDVLGASTWRPQAREKPQYGVLALLMGTLMTTLGAMLIAVPLGISTAAWLAFGAQGRLRELVKLGVELLAAVPSVVIGFVGIQLVGPSIASLLNAPGGLTALNGALLLAIMALPTIVSISEDALGAVPRDLVEGALALGADRWQMLVGVAAPAARSGLFAATMLGMGRAIGETMTVLMATGNAVAWPQSLLDPVRTLTATVAIELGEVARGTTHYFMLFVVGLILFVMTFAVNLAADLVQQRGEKAMGRQ